MIFKSLREKIDMFILHIAKTAKGFLIKGIDFIVIDFLNISSRINRIGKEDHDSLSF